MFLRCLHISHLNSSLLLYTQTFSMYLVVPGSTLWSFGWIKSKFFSDVYTRPLYLFGLQLSSESIAFPFSPWWGPWHGLDDDVEWLELWSWGDDGQGMGKMERLSHAPPYCYRISTWASILGTLASHTLPQPSHVLECMVGMELPTGLFLAMVFAGTLLGILLWDKPLPPGSSQRLSFPLNRWWFSLHCFIHWQPESML